MRISLLGIVVLSLCLHSAPATAAEPVARIVKVNGKVAIHQANNSTRPAGLYGCVYGGERLSFAPQASVALGWLSDGRVEEVSAANGDVAVTEDCCNPKGTVLQAAARRQKIAVAAVKALPPITTGGVTVPRAGGQKPSAPRISPINDTTILADRVEFTWPAQPGATRYQVALYRGATGQDVVWKKATPEAAAKYNGTLRRGIQYRWTVSSGDPNQEVKGQFQVADEEQVEEAEELKEMASGEHPAMVFLAAARYEQNSMYSEAIDAYEKLAKLTPEESPVLAALAELYQRAGRADESNKMRSAAEKLGFKFQ